MRLTVRTATVSSAQLDSCYIGTRALSGDAWDFAGDQVQVKFGGSGTKTLASSTTYVSDPVAFSPIWSRDLIVSAHFSGTTVNLAGASNTSNETYYYQAADEASVSNVSGYTNLSQETDFVLKIEAASNVSAW